jgi:hypothetical protein
LHRFCRWRLAFAWERGNCDCGLMTVDGLWRPTVWGHGSDEMASYLVDEQWRTYETEFSCRECVALNRRVSLAGTGPHPPLHPGRRCQRVFDHMERVGGEEEGDDDKGAGGSG